MAAAASYIVPPIDNFLLKLASISTLLALEGDRNTTDASEATTADCRPDCLIWHNLSLVFKGEDKSDRHTLEVPIKELGEKMARQWSLLTMGSLPFLLCYASCGRKIQLCVVMRNSNIAEAISEVLDLSHVSTVDTLVHDLSLLYQVPSPM